MHGENVVGGRRLDRDAGVTPEALAYLASQYRELGGQRGAVNYLADFHGVSRTTIWRRLKRAGVEQPRR
jgi:transcriptional regulator of acetoin/glycerol metabolism